MSPRQGRTAARELARIAPGRTAPGPPGAILASMGAVNRPNLSGSDKNRIDSAAIICYANPISIRLKYIWCVNKVLA